MGWLRRLWNTLHPGRVATDIEREIAFHIAMRADELRQKGVNDEDALRRARLQFGHPPVQRERMRDVDMAEWLDAGLRYGRQACRSLVRTPVFSATVVLTLAVGIGANTAVFSAIDAVLLRPLPFPEPDRLVRLTEVTHVAGETNTAAVRLEEWGRLSSTFTAITHYTEEDVSDNTGATPQAVVRATVGPSFVDVVGLPLARGRTFTEAEHRMGGGSDVALISDRYWRHQFNADPQVLGRAVRMAQRPYTIVGVMAPGFAFPSADVDWWVPQWSDAPWIRARQLRYSGVGRLKPGVSLEQAAADLDAVQARLAQQYPTTDRDLQPRVTPMKDTFVGDVRASLWLLFGSVSVLLLIACTNIAALLLTRGAQRQQEIAVRQALGSSRRSLVLQLLTESALLATVGAALGLAVAVALAAVFKTLAPAFPRLDAVTLSGPVWIYLAAVTAGVAVVCGLVPALRSSRADALRAATHRQVSTRQPLQWWLVGVQVALAVALLAGAGLLVRSLDFLLRTDDGFVSTGVVTFRVTASFGEERDYSRTVQRITRTLDALASLPGVSAAATTLRLPGIPGRLPQSFTVVEAPARDGADTTAEFRIVSPSYFQATGIPVLEGELCRDGGTNGPSEVMVNRAFASRFLAGQSAVGLHLTGTPPDRIAGVVADAREGGRDTPPAPTVYPCFAAATPKPWFLVRTPERSRSSASPAAIRRAVYTIDPLRSVYDVVPLDSRISDVYGKVRVRTILLTLFAVTALLLSSLGVYGALSYVISLRSREAGLRVALGASRLGIVRQFCGHALRVIVIACASGLLLSAAFTRVLSGMLYGVSPLDPATLAGVVVLMLIVGCTAALLPSVRAALAEPANVLRGD